MRQLSTAIAVAAGLGAFAASAAGAGTPTTKSVKVGDDFFSKAKVSVKKGDIVRWTWGKNGTKHKHTVTEEHGNWTSKEKKTGTYKHTFGKTGTFRIYCATHPLDMKMKVVVSK
jgi:plastocyanin